ncbi:MAG: dTDP-glucose 4,6-dehydratase [Candidatus Deianiraeaceae bacterium]|jgi:dTDP-glucose 4,6-dehydratase
MKNILVTGGCGFIGSHFCHLLHEKELNIFVVDKLTYAANMHNIHSIPHHFFQCSIGNGEFIAYILREYKIDAVVNFAAESHVDNSISNPDVFIQTNIVETHRLLKVCIEWQKVKKDFKFVHVSTDEVFGDLHMGSPKFSESTAYNPSSPYSASKAGSDHIVHAYIRTFGLNGVITNCSNNYGSMQNKEKLIPKIISRCLSEESLTIYGSGENIRDWIHVKDHCNGIWLALEKGVMGESYCFGGDCERSVGDTIHVICKIMNRVKPRTNGVYEDLIVHIADRIGHDFRYAINDEKAQKELGFQRQEKTFEENIEDIVRREFL